MFEAKTEGRVETLYNIAENRWYGWLQMPAASPGWAASPVFVTKVTPLKSGQGLLRLRFLQPLWPGGGCQREVTLRVVLHRADHVVAALEQGGVKHSVMIAAAKFDWLESYCPEHLRRRPPTSSGLVIDGNPLSTTTVDKHLANVFGTTPQEILTGATAASFEIDRMPPLPTQVSTFFLDTAAPPLDSLLIARGFVPQQMEDKWFIYMEAGHLLFRRSWTGMLIYTVEAQWRGDQLYLGVVRVNRDPEQYGETDDRHDGALLRWLIDVVLRGVPADFPMKHDDA
jgi:hypothetical protein